MYICTYTMQQPLTLEAAIQARLVAQKKRRTAELAFNIGKFGPACEQLKYEFGIAEREYEKISRRVIELQARN